MAGQQEAQRNQLAQQQLKQSGMQMEQTQLQVDQLKRDRDALAKLQEQFVANGKSPNLEENFGAMIQSGIPHFVDIGTQGLQKIQQQKQFANIMGGSNTAPVAPAAPVARAAPGALSSGTYDVNAPVTPVNALAPVAAPAPVSNALSPDVSGLRQKRDALLGMGTQQSIAAAKALDADIALASREPVYHNVPGVGLVDPRTKQIVMPSVESTQPEIKQYEYAKNNGYKGSFEDFKVLSAPKTNISLTQNAEKSYGTAFGGKIADLDVARYDAANKAPELAANANRVLSSLNDGNVFVGPAASVKLNLARVLNAAGASNDEKIANTETLISNLGRNTLGMVKSSGLGTGQGFTDKDLQFLERVAGGSIDYNAQTLRNLAELSHKAATASAETWSKRVKEIPASALGGTGISTETIVVPPRFTKAATATRPAGVPSEWTLHTDAAGKKAYVSPDGKSFKEVP